MAKNSRIIQNSQERARNEERSLAAMEKLQINIAELSRVTALNVSETRDLAKEFKESQKTQKKENRKNHKATSKKSSNTDNSTKKETPIERYLNAQQKRQNKIFGGVSKVVASIVPSKIGAHIGDSLDNFIQKKSKSFSNISTGQKISDYQSLVSQGAGKKAAAEAVGMKLSDIKKTMNSSSGQNMIAGAAEKAAGMESGGIAGMAGSILKAAGPIGAVMAAAKMAFDFWDSGGAAKVAAGAKALTGANDALYGEKGIKYMTSKLKGTEQFRKIETNQEFVKPVELRQEQEKELYQWRKDADRNELKFAQSLVTDRLSFEQQQTTKTLDARQQREKALYASGLQFIGKYQSISERALEAIGSSTKAVIEGISISQGMFSATLKDSTKLSENAQSLAYEYGAGAEDVLQMSNLFRLMNKTTGQVGENLVAGMSALAKTNGVSPQAVFKQISTSAGELYKFSDGTAENLAKQAISLTKMGVSMQSMMQASNAMVLNYKDSIKAEMSLSAMLGKNVDLSEARARLMAGDEAGGAQAIKTALAGTDIGSMNAFQKQQLSSATGMDIQSLMGLMQGKTGDVTGNLQQNEKAGADIARGALKQEVAQAGQKLALEQSQRKDMMDLELKLRLDNLKQEFSIRNEYERDYGIKFAEEMVSAQAIAEVNSNALVFAKRKTDVEGSMKASGLDTSFTQPNYGITKTGNLPSAQITPSGTGGQTQITSTLSKASDLQIQATTKVADNQAIATKNQIRTLSAYEYQTQIQQEMIALLGVASQFLGQISENTAKDASININGKVLSTTLLNQAKKQYGVARTG